MPPATVSPSPSRTRRRARRRTGTPRLHETVNGPATGPGRCTSARAFRRADRSPFYTDIETLLHSGVTVGCQDSIYCPDAPVTRAQMAMFLLKAKLGRDVSPALGSGTVFTDVPPGPSRPTGSRISTRPASSAGCHDSFFCPRPRDARGRWRSSCLKSSRGSGYVPPPASGIFDDVPAGDQFAPWIEELSRSGITAGCGGDDFCPDRPNTRAEMATFLNLTFGLKLYGP